MVHRDYEYPAASAGKRSREFNKVHLRLRGAMAFN
jgi:hypothetical protein